MYAILLYACCKARRKVSAAMAYMNNINHLSYHILTLFALICEVQENHPYWKKQKIK